MNSDRLNDINKHIICCKMIRYACSDKISQIVTYHHITGKQLGVTARQFIDASLHSLEEIISELRSSIDEFNTSTKSSTKEDLDAIRSAKDEIYMAERIINDCRQVMEFIDDNWRDTGDNTECEGT